MIVTRIVLSVFSYSDDAGLFKEQTLRPLLHCISYHWWVVTHLLKFTTPFQSKLFFSNSYISAYITQYHCYENQYSIYYCSYLWRRKHDMVCWVWSQIIVMHQKWYLVYLTVVTQAGKICRSYLICLATL